MTEPVEGPSEGTDIGSVDPADDAPDGGIPAVTEAQSRLDELDGAPLERHVEVFEDVHRRLQEGLADLDER